MHYPHPHPVHRLRERYHPVVLVHVHHHYAVGQRQHAGDDRVRLRRVCDCGEHPEPDGGAAAGGAPEDCAGVAAGREGGQRACGEGTGGRESQLGAGRGKEGGTHVPALVEGALEQYSWRGVRDEGRGVAVVQRAR